MVARATSLEVSKNQLQIIHLQPKFYQPHKQVEINQVDAETTCLTEIVKKETRAEQKPAFGCALCRPGRLIKFATWPAHQAMLCQVELSVGRPPDPSWKRPPGRPRTKWTNQLRRDNNNVPIATLWRQATGRGHSRATLRSEPTTHLRRRRIHST